MATELRCELCGVDMGEINQGRIRRGAVVLCKECWGKADRLLKLALSYRDDDVPGVVKELFGKFGKYDAKGHY